MRAVEAEVLRVIEMNAEHSHASILVRPAVLVLFGVSGATGLVYEVAWARRFGVVFGNTIFASSAVLTAFMLGLAVGTMAFRRKAVAVTT